MCRAPDPPVARSHNRRGFAPLLATLLERLHHGEYRRHEAHGESRVDPSIPVSIAMPIDFSALVSGKRFRSMAAGKRS
jgi:hypothetical protein